MHLPRFHGYNSLLQLTLVISDDIPHDIVAQGKDDGQAVQAVVIPISVQVGPVALTNGI